MYRTLSKIKGFHALSGATFFCRGKRRQNRFSPDARRCCASVPCAPRQAGHGAQTRFAQTGRLFGPAWLRCSARFTAQAGEAKRKCRSLKAIATATATATAVASLRLKAAAGSRAFTPFGRDFLLSWQKEAKPLLAGTRADAAHRCPALLAKQGTAPKLASLKQGASSALLGCGARRALRLRQGKQGAKAEAVEQQQQQQQQQRD